MHFCQVMQGVDVDFDMVVCEVYLQCSVVKVHGDILFGAAPGQKSYSIFVL